MNGSNRNNRNHRINRIEVIISPDGSSRLETKGFRGGNCREASRFLEHALGISRAEQLTDEFYRSVASSDSVKLRQDGQQ